MIIINLAGCGVSVPRDLLQTEGSALAIRQLQTRLYPTKDEEILITGAINLFQDMGYSIDTSNKDLGLILAFKSVDADNAGTDILRFLALLNKPIWDTSGTGIPDRQEIHITFTVKPSMRDDGFLARITLKRVMVDESDTALGADHASPTGIPLIDQMQETALDREKLLAEELYDEFFEKLSKSIFLESNKI